MSAQGQTKKCKPDQSQVECFFCKKQGHWKRNCPLYIASLDPNRPKKKQGTYMITPCNFSICDTSAWVLDTESPYHICNSMQGLQVSRRFDEGERFLNVGDGSKVSILALGIMNLVINSRNVILSECHYCPSFLLNIIFVGLLAMNGYQFLIKKIFTISFWMVLQYLLDNFIMKFTFYHNLLMLFKPPVNILE